MERQRLARTFSEMVLLDLERAGCKKAQMAAVVSGTIGTTIVFLRANRRDALAKQVSASLLAEREHSFETALLKAALAALPKSKKRGRKPDSLGKLKTIRILELMGQNRTFPEIAKELGPEFGHASAAAYRMHLNRSIPALRRAFFAAEGVYRSRLFYGE